MNIYYTTFTMDAPSHLVFSLCSPLTIFLLFSMSLIVKKTAEMGVPLQPKTTPSLKKMMNFMLLVLD